MPRKRGFASSKWLKKVETTSSAWLQVALRSSKLIGTARPLVSSSDQRAKIKNGQIV
jgi:hypothetical protein